MQERIGLVGLGAMGFPMAKQLLAAGHNLAVVPHTNRRVADDLAKMGATVSETASALGRDRDVVIICVPDVPEVEEVLFGEKGLLAGNFSRDLLVIDMSTINPTAARRHSELLADRGVAALDAPVSGGPARAADGTLTIMVGGSKSAFEKARPILEKLGKNIIHVGEAGAGQAVKHVNQLMISIIMIANAEALTMGVKAGISLETMIDVISTSSGSNYLLQNWLPKTLFSGDISGGFALDLLMKDLSAAMRWAADLGLPSFGGALAQQLYRIAQAQGMGRMDYSAVAKLYEDVAGVELRLRQE